MKYIDLINKLSDEDKIKIKNYITLYGINEDNFLGLDKWLSNWSHSNQVLFKLLNYQLIYKVPFSYLKRVEDIQVEVEEIIKNDPFIESFKNFYIDFIRNQKDISTECKVFIHNIVNTEYFVHEEIMGLGIKYKRPGAKKTLQIPPGMKPIRALQKIVDYFKDDWNWNLEDLEKLRISLSIVFNDKKVNGKLCFSIHPLDYMTMSDNGSNWSSCMSWMKEGCYRLGTLEMMNSNNVICCYIERKSDYFTFANETDKKEDDFYLWNNKKWRVLAYINKDIIMAGKAYPYRNDDYSKAVISEIKKLAIQNLHWHYSFGPELYKDMKYVNTEYPFIRARNYIKRKECTKHNILWDTHGMYNDMLNDHSNHYWCFRNKVSHTKIYSVSGKAPCLCCGTDMSELNYSDSEEDYNERYSNGNYLVCIDCFPTFECATCNHYNPRIKHFPIIFNHINNCYICEECLKQSIFVCPGCGKPIYVDNIPYSAIFNNTIKKGEIKLISNYRSSLIQYIPDFIWMCHDCAIKNIDKFDYERITMPNITPSLSRVATIEWIFFHGDDSYAYKNLKHFDGNINNKEIKNAITREELLTILKKK